MQGQVGAAGTFPDTLGWTIAEWVRAQRAADSPDALVLGAYERLRASFGGGGPDSAWITLAERKDVVRQLETLRGRLEAQGGVKERFPLFGVPYAVKDNIDVVGFPTTAACPAFARQPSEDAHVVRLLRDAGAIVFGKTNLDQFATGLVGTRSPYGAVPSEFDAARIGGGSSSGSAAVVARGRVPFALGTDTAGSGRVPAAFQNVVGLKPTRGRWSTRGVVPACRTLDCVSVFTLTPEDALLIDSLLADGDPLDAYARPVRNVAPSRYPLTVGVPSELRFLGDELAKAAFELALTTLRSKFRVTEVDFTPFYDLAKLLYAESWVAERALVAGELLDRPSEMDPTVHRILSDAKNFTALDAFRAEYARAELAKAIFRTFSGVDLICVPTTPTTYRFSEVAEDPLGTNSNLGTYTNFTNLADLCGVALPAPFRADDFPAGVTLLAPAHHERAILSVASELGAKFALPLGSTGRPRGSDPLGRESAPQGVPLVVLGAHLSGMRLNDQLVERGARLLTETRTSSAYRLYLLDEAYPARPALRRVSPPELGAEAGIVVEVWDVPEAALGSFLKGIARPLGLGQVELRDGSWTTGFICEPVGLLGARDITDFGGYRAFMAYGGS